MSPTEVTVSLKDHAVLEWDMDIGDPFHTPLAPCMVFMAYDVADALRDGLKVWPRGGELRVTPDGYATAVVYGGGEAVYELFPARFDDDRPYEPLIYVGRWPD